MCNVDSGLSDKMLFVRIIKNKILLTNKERRYMIQSNKNQEFMGVGVLTKAPVGANNSRKFPKNKKDLLYQKTRYNLGINKKYIYD